MGCVIQNPVADILGSDWKKNSEGVVHTFNIVAIVIKGS